MTTGELSPWAPGSPNPPLGPDAGSTGGTYRGPWQPPSGPSPTWGPAPGWTDQPGPSDHELAQLPPPLVGAPPGPPQVDQRPAVVGLAVTLAVTASLLWVCGLSLFLLVAVAATQAMSPTGADGYVFHTLDEAVLRMGDGLWVPLYGFPVASLVSGFLLLARRPWTRLAHTAVAVAALGWAAWWLRESLLVWVVVLVYVGTAVAVTWAPSVSRWYARRPRRAGLPG